MLTMSTAITNSPSRAFTVRPPDSWCPAPYRSDGCGGRPSPRGTGNVPRVQPGEHGLPSHVLRRAVAVAGGDPRLRRGVEVGHDRVEFSGGAGDGLGCGGHDAVLSVVGRAPAGSRLGRELGRVR